MVGLDRAALDRYITGNYGEDQFFEESPAEAKAYNQGYAAGARELGARNPYPLESPEWYSWEAGRADASPVIH